MALSASVLSAAMRAAMLADPDIEAIDDVRLTKMCDALAGAVVSHITSSAVVVPGTTLIAPGGMTPAPCTGTATIT